MLRDDIFNFDIVKQIEIRHIFTTDTILLLIKVFPRVIWLEIFKKLGFYEILYIKVLIDQFIKTDKERYEMWKDCEGGNPFTLMNDLYNSIKTFKKLYPIKIIYNKFLDYYEPYKKIEYIICPCGAFVLKKGFDTHQTTITHKKYLIRTFPSHILNMFILGYRGVPSHIFKKHMFNL